MKKLSFLLFLFNILSWNFTLITGAIKFAGENEVVRVGGVKYTIKDGIIYDAKKLLQDVARQVTEAKEQQNYKLKQPGIGVE